MEKFVLKDNSYAFAIAIFQIVQAIEIECKEYV
jgi:hypothetical protein